MIDVRYSHSTNSMSMKAVPLVREDRVVTWPEVLSIIAAMAAAGSLLVAYMAYRIAALQALPHPNIGWTAGPGQRSLSFTITRDVGKADWVVTSATIRGNWRRRRYLARGQVYDVQVIDDDWIEFYEPAGPWQQCVIFDPPVIEGALVLHPDTPDCEVKLKLTLRTLPSPKVVRRIVLKRIPRDMY